MSFIGIICENRYGKLVKQTLSKYLKNTNIIIFNKENIENMKNIKFETVAIFSDNKNVFSCEQYLSTIIKKANYLIINSDEISNLNLLKNIKAKVITYGFNTKSTITTSSVDDDELLLYIQHSVVNINNKEIEQQEISIQKNNIKLSVNIIIGIVTTLLLYGIYPVKI